MRRDILSQGLLSIGNTKTAAFIDWARKGLQTVGKSTLNAGAAIAPRVGARNAFVSGVQGARKTLGGAGALNTAVGAGVVGAGALGAAGGLGYAAGRSQ